MISNGALDTTTGEFVFEGEFTDPSDYHVLLSDDGAGANVQ